MDTYKRLIIISIYLFFSIYLCPAFTLTGIIEDSDNPDTTVKNTVIVVKKLNKIVYPDKNSKFSIKNLPKGTYSIDVTAPGYNKKRIIVIIDKTDISLKIRLTPETIVMNPIIVSAEKTKRQSPDSTVFTSDEIRTAPTAGNPFNIVPILEGALPLNTIENTGDVIPWDMPGGYLLGEQGYARQRISIWGGAQEWNGYYYGYIHLPFYMHLHGFPYPNSIIPIRSIKSLDTYRGAWPLKYGPGIGGLFRIEPVDTVKAKKDISLQLSPSDLSLFLELPFGKNINSVISLRKSIFEYTYLPLIKQLAGSILENTPDRAGNGDLLLRLLYKNEINTVSLDVIGSYDSYMLNQYTSVSDDNSASGLKTTISSSGTCSFFYGVSGIKWKLDRDVFSNSLWTYVSGYTNKLLWDERDDETGKLSLSKDYNYSSYEINIGDEFAYYLLSSMTLNMGSKINLLNLNGDLKTFRIRKMYYDSSGLNDQFKDQGKDFNYNREIKGISPYIYADLDFRNDLLSWVLGLGYKWYDIEKIGRFTTEGLINLKLFKDLTTGIKAGLSPGRYSSFNYLEKDFNEAYLGESNSSLSVPMSAFSLLYMNYKPFSFNLIKMDSYFVYYYDIAGIFYETSYKDFNSSSFVSGIPVFLNPDYGYSTGMDISWLYFPNDKFSLKFIYSPAWTRYHTKEQEWVYSNNDIRHSIKIILSYKPSINFLISSDLFIFIDKAFTPYRVVDLNNDGTADGITAEKLNSGRDFMPRYKFDINLKWNFKLWGGTASVFFNSVNLLFFLNPTINPANRRYDFYLNPYNLLKSEIGFSISY
ncbi:MAG: carboxypeptidase-like regulatory domain-containing protein [Spirochaetes bacterium]|nr:carboxypeptidase-like regulatory domain-containing protein [Spirochaetota bacterium]